MSTRPKCILCNDHKQQLPLVLCQADLRQLGYDEGELLDLDDMLLEKPRRSLSRSTGTDSTGETWKDDDPRKGASVRPLPMNAGAERERRRIRRLTIRWVVVTAQAHGLTLPEKDDPYSCIQWLVQPAVRGLLLASDAAADYAREIHRAVEQAREIAAPDPIEGLPIGMHRRRNKVGDLVDCGKVWATMDGWATCRKCDEQAVVSWWQEQWPEQDSDPMTITEAAAWASIHYHRPVKPKDIRNYIERGHLRRCTSKKLGQIAVYRGDLRMYGDATWLTAVAQVS